MKTRMHPSIILENLISSLGLIVIIFIYLIIDEVNNDNLETLSNLAKDIPFIGVLIAILIFFGLLLIFTIYFFSNFWIVSYQYSFFTAHIIYTCYIILNICQVIITTIFYFIKKIFI